MSNFINKEIAEFSGKHSIPKDITLAANPNFLQWVGKKKDVDFGKKEMIYDTRTVVELHFKGPGLKKNENGLENTSLFDIIGANKDLHSFTFHGRPHDSQTPYFVGNDFHYYVYEEQSGMSRMTSSLIYLLRSHKDFFSTEFNVTAVGDTIILLESKKLNTDYKLELKNYNSEFVSMKTYSIVLSKDYSIENTNTLDFSFRIQGITTADPIFSFKLNGEEYAYSTTTDKLKIDSRTFFYDKDNLAVSAENLRRCMNMDAVLKSNFDIYITPITTKDGIATSDTIRFRSKTDKNKYSFKLEKNNIIEVANDVPSIQQHDAFIGNETDTEIQIEYFTNTGVFLGEHRLPKYGDKMGDYVTTQSKAYMGDPVWFDLNSVARNIKSYSNAVIIQSGWVDAGTLTDYRILGKRYDGKNTETFYMSDVMYALNGYKRNLEENDLSEYVLSIDDPSALVKPLTTQPQLMHVKGQKQFFNFLLSDPNHTNDEVHGKNIGIYYKIWTQSGSFMEKKISHTKSSKEMGIVNSICLDFDDLITEKVGRVEAYLCYIDEIKEITEIVSEPLIFTILPNYLYPINDFAFLNSLGGWSSFNFSGTDQTEFKTKGNTFSKTQTPNFSTSSDMESVYDRKVEEQFTVQSMPVNRATADWLRELSASPVVYHVQNGVNRYVVVDDLTVKHNSKDELFVLQMKYHYSDVYNAA